MRRRRRGWRRPAVVPRAGDVVVDAAVRARVLGIHLLDLDAHVVVATAREDGTVGSRAAPAALPVTSRELPGRRDATPAAARRELSRAVRLLVEGDAVLDDARSIRLRQQATPDGRDPERRSAH